MTVASKKKSRKVTGPENKNNQSLLKVGFKWTGQIRVDRISGRSRATQMVYRNPLRIFERPENDRCVLTVSNYGGGILQGDCLSLSISCGSGSSTVLTGQASTHVYRNEKREFTSFTMRVSQNEHSSVQIIPEPVVLHKDAMFSQVNTFNLHRGASLLFADHVQPGRYGNGERFLFHSYTTETKINVREKTVVLDRFCMYPAVYSDTEFLTASQENTYGKQSISTSGSVPDGVANWNGCNQLLTLYCIGPKYAGLVNRLEGMKNSEQKKIRPLLKHSSRPLTYEKKDQCWIAVTPVHRMEPGTGFIVRVLCSERNRIDKVLKEFSL